ncbi:MAG: RrF2 family transcriptional regulator [Coriobacteriales bacterium]
MLVSTKGRYALKFLLDLAQHKDEGPIPLKDIAKRQGISKKYLERIVALLGSSDMLRITRGYQGGYELVRDPSKVSVAEILMLTEGGFYPVPVEELQQNNITTYVWESLEGAITRCLENMTLQDIIDNYNPPLDYCI